MVQLKGTRLVTPTSIIAFQFQYGTIKRGFLACVGSGKTIFQFQYGTIKREAKKAILKTIIHFNSNMVQLKVKNTAMSSFDGQSISIPIWYN